MRHTISLILMLSVQAAFAQAPLDFDLLVNTTHAKRTLLLNDYYERDILLYDSLEVAGHVEEVRRLAREHDDRELEHEAEIMRAHYLVNAKSIDDAHVIKECKKLVALGENSGVVWLQVRAHSLLGHFYLNKLTEYAHGIFHLTKAAELMRHLDVAEYPLKYLCSYHVGLWQFQLDDLEEALESFRSALDPAPKNMSFRSNIFTHNSIGLLFRRSNQLDSSDAYITNALRFSLESNDSAWVAITSGNLGENHFLRGEFDQAIPLLQTDLDMAEQTGDRGLAANALTLLGQIALMRGDLSSADEQLHQAAQYARDWYELKRFEKIYPSLAKLAARQGRPLLVAAYIDSARMVADSMIRLKSSLLSTKAQQSVEREHLQDAMRMAQLEKDKNVAERNAAIALLAALLAFFVLIFSQLWKRYRSKGNQLVSAKRALEEFARTLAERNRQLADVRHTADVQSDEGLTELRQATILTDEDWERFKQLFEKVYSGYLQRLTARFPEINASDMRFIALTRMNLSPLEMADMLGVGKDTIRQHRRRLRKRLSLGLEDDLSALISSV